MNVLDAVYQRRAVKHYDAQHEMTQEEQQTLFDAAIQAPTAFNIQNWRLVHVTDPTLRQNIRENAWDQAQVTDASMLLVLCADLKSWEKEPERYWRLAPQEVQDFMIPAIDKYYRGKEQVQRDEAMRSCGLIGQTIMLTAKALGYDSCPMDGFDFDAVGKLIKLPEDHVIAFMIAVGKPTQEARPKGGQLPVNEIVFENGWN